MLPGYTHQMTICRMETRGGESLSRSDYFSVLLPCSRHQPCGHPVGVVAGISFSTYSSERKNSRREKLLPAFVFSHQKILHGISLSRGEFFPRSPDIGPRPCYPKRAFLLPPFIASRYSRPSCSEPLSRWRVRVPFGALAYGVGLVEETARMLSRLSYSPACSRFESRSPYCVARGSFFSRDYPCRLYRRRVFSVEEPLFVKELNDSL